MDLLDSGLARNEDELLAGDAHIMELNMASKLRLDELLFFFTIKAKDSLRKVFKVYTQETTFLVTEASDFHGR